MSVPLLNCDLMESRWCPQTHYIHFFYNLAIWEAAVHVFKYAAKYVSTYIAR